MTFNLYTAAFLSIFFLVNCGSNPTKSTYIDDPVEREILASLEKNSNDLQKLEQTGDFYRSRFEEKGNTNDAKQAIKYYQDILAIDPSLIFADVYIYDIYYRLHILNKNRNFKRLVEQFEKLPTELHAELYPPEISEIYRKTKGRFQHNALELNLSLRAIKRNKVNHVAYILAADNYSINSNTNSAIAILKQGLNQQPENTEILNALGFSYIQKANDKECRFDDERSWKNAIKYFTEVKKLDSEDVFSRVMLSEAYYAVGQKQLGIIEAKKAAKINSTNNNNNHLLAFAYSMQGKYTKSNNTIAQYTQLKQYNYFQQMKALKLYEMINFSPNDILLDIFNKNNAVEFAEMYIRNGHWHNTLKHYKNHNYRNRNNYSIYPIIRSDIAAKALNDTWKPDYRLFPKKHSAWEQIVIDYWLGKASMATLLENAVDRCKKTEAYTYIGVNYFNLGYINNAKVNFSLALEQDIPTLVESSIALHFLKLIEKSDLK